MTESSAPRVPDVAIRVVDETGTPISHPLPLSASSPRLFIRLKTLAGSEGLRLELELDGKLDTRIEIPARQGEMIDVWLSWQEGLTAECERRMIFLPLDDRYGAVPPIFPNREAERVDLALVIDATALHFPAPEEEARPEDAEKPEKRPRPVLFFESPERRADFAARIQSFVSALAEGVSELRWALVTYGDVETRPGAVEARDLSPRVHLDPSSDRLFLQPLRAGDDGVERAVEGIRPSSGGDVVDALADALAACRQLAWAEGARRLVVAVGDSPGHSLIHPPPLGANAQARELDVDSQAQELQRRGIGDLRRLHRPTRRIRTRGPSASR